MLYCLLFKGAVVKRVYYFYSVYTGQHLREKDKNRGKHTNHLPTYHHPFTYTPVYIPNTYLLLCSPFPPKPFTVLGYRALKFHINFEQIIRPPVVKHPKQEHMLRMLPDCFHHNPAVLFKICCISEHLNIEWNKQLPHLPFYSDHQ